MGCGITRKAEKHNKKRLTSRVETSQSLPITVRPEKGPAPMPSQLPRFGVHFGIDSRQTYSHVDIYCLTSLTQNVRFWFGELESRSYFTIEIRIARFRARSSAG